jgi:predicted PurR-regulated permease PerM
VLAVVAAGYAAHAGRAIVVPAVIAIILNTLLSPAIRTLARAHIAPALGAAILVVGLAVAIGGIGFAVAEPTAQWVSKAPAALDSAATRVRSLGRRVAAVSRETEQAQQVAGVAGPARTPVSTGPSIVQRVFGTAAALVAGAVEVALLLYFLLASQDLYPRKLVALLPGVDDDETAARIARSVEHTLSRYMVTEAALNIALGIQVGLALWALGMPTPWLWGSMAAVLAFIPYVGSLLLLGVLAVVALTVMPSPTRALAVPVTYFVLNFVSANLMTPIVLGSRLTLHPVAILAGLTFWWGMWGVPGAFLSVPLLATIHVLGEQVPALSRLGNFIGARERGRRGT